MRIEHEELPPVTLDGLTQEKAVEAIFRNLADTIRDERQRLQFAKMATLALFKDAHAERAASLGQSVGGHVILTHQEAVELGFTTP